MTDHSEKLRAAFAARLERVRGSLTDAEFERLVADMVKTAARLEEIEGRALHTGDHAIPVSREPEMRQ